MTGIELRADTAGEGQLEALLRRCDASFVPPLGTRVDIAAYARKLAQRALRLEAWHGDDIVALLAMYCNDTGTRMAFITSVSVDPDYARRGIADALLDEAKRRALAAGMRRIELEVGSDNTAALRLYQKHGFTASGAPMHMGLNLKGGIDNE